MNISCIGPFSVDLQSFRPASLGNVVIVNTLLGVSSTGTAPLTRVLQDSDKALILLFL